MSRGADVVVVGGGAIGCSVAFHLAREGAEVTLLERGEIAGAASGAAAGMLLPTGEAPGPGPLLTWGVRSLERFPGLCAELRERTGIDPELELRGALHVADSDRRRRELPERFRGVEGLGIEWLDAEATRAAEPALATGVRGGLWSPREGHVRSPLLVRAFAAAAEALGARIERGTEVLGLRCEGGRVVGVRTDRGDRPGARVVLCTGAWLPRVADWLAGAPPLPIEPVRGQILCLDPPLPRLGSIVSGDGVYLVPKRDGSVVVGATEERVGFDTRVTAQGVAALLEDALRLAPGLAGATFRSAWAGLRPASPDGLPLIGTWPGREELILAAGHTRNGVLLAPVTGELVADLLRGKPLPGDAAAFRPDRFG